MTTENAANSARRIAIVTGGSRGLGRNTVVNLPAAASIRSSPTIPIRQRPPQSSPRSKHFWAKGAVALQLDTGNVASSTPLPLLSAKHSPASAFDKFDYLRQQCRHVASQCLRTDDGGRTRRPFSVHFKGAFFLT